MDLNTILIILGILALVALVAHGLWSNRREKSQYFENANTFGRANRQDEPISTPESYKQARNVAPAFTQPKQAVIHQEPPVQQPLNTEPEPITQETPVRAEPQSVDQIKITLPNVEPAPAESAPIYEMRPSRRNTEPQYYQQPSEPYYQQPAQQNLARQTIADIEATADPNEGVNSSSEYLRTQLQEASQEGNQIFTQSPLSRAPLQQPIEFDQPAQQEKESDNNEDEDVSFVMLYVAAAENRQFQGTVLVQALEDLGFSLGEDNLYHRHLDLTVASPVLFSAANITQPGTFNPYTLHEFFTDGVAIFMRLPSPGNDRTNLKIMIRSAKTLAQQLGGFVLTEQQELFTDAVEEEYLAKIK
ncbi:cell division protein ZipA [Basfia succiniciproducens]|uniref:cell division protein ZipA n=1 Tax=Basfia succiniciproducens TaxID=653940 RepID=UPI0008CE7AA3|nr:cell division protein ZipA [Basfia succiniciproducens]SEQ84301.1 cell division protein ZipA [Basfia succiniciproducens]